MLRRPISIASVLIASLASVAVSQSPEPLALPTVAPAGAESAKASDSLPGNRVPEQPKLEPTQAQPQPLEVLRVFDLQHMDASIAAALLQSIYKPSELTVVAEQRLGDLVVRGNDLVLQEVEVLLKRLDEPGAKNPLKPAASILNTEPKPAAADLPSDLPSSMQQLLNGLMATQAAAETGQGPRTTIASLRNALRQVEAQAQQTAKLLQSRSDSKRNYQAETDELREQVSQAFRLRQALQRAEVHQFLHRLLQVSQTIELREGIASEIVERRMRELLKATSIRSADVSNQRTEALPELPQPSAATDAKETSAASSAAHKPLPQFRFSFNNSRGASAIQWLDNAGSAVSGRMGTFISLTTGERSEFRMNGFSGYENLRAFVSAHVPILPEKVATIVSLNTAELQLSVQDFEKLKAGEILTRVFWIPNDLTEAGENLIMVADDPAEIAERGTVVATLRMAVDAKKVFSNESQGHHSDETGQ